MRFAAAVALALCLAMPAAAEAAPRARLSAFSSCRALVDYARAGAERTDGGVGVIGRAAPTPIDAVVTPPLMPQTRTGDIPPTAAVPVSGGTAVGGAVPEFSGTNTQEIGVDEPDIVKTDGRRIFAVTDRTLRVIDVASGTVTGTLALDGYGHQLLLRGNRLLAIATKGAPNLPIERPIAPLPTIAVYNPTTVVTEIDVSGAPKVLRTMDVPGRFVDARQNGGTARLVIDSAPAPIAEPATAKLARFLKRTVLHSNLSGRTFKRNLAPCGAISHPRRVSGLDGLAILTVDLDRGMYSLDRDGVMAGAEVVYGSSDSLYVASRRYVRALELGTDVPEGMRTEIHRFDLSDPDKTVYKATGTVPGFVLNNYALSEYRGKLRVATTEDPQWFADGTNTHGKSTVSVLEQQGSKLATVGAVTGLGTGQRIYAVRFLGDRGYVVTFRQIDPLYVLDLSKPTAPRVTGELELPGYSAYLHPVGGERLLGIGREGANVKASLFDVSNPAAPTQLSTLGFGPGLTPVESEPHAFLYWAPSNLAVLPLTTYDGFTGAAGVRIAPTALTSAGRVEHHTDQRAHVPIERAFVIGDRLYTLSYLGVLSSGLGDLGPLRFTAF
jgi:uncharacterized secreted protein with C-terminal beta-propeller domain